MAVHPSGHRPSGGASRAERRREAAAVLRLRRGERWRAGAALASGAGAELAGIGLLATSAWLIAAASHRPPILTLSVAIVGVRFFALTRAAARYGERLTGHDLALTVLTRVRADAFVRLEPLVPGRWPGTRRGDLLTRLVSDLDGVQDLTVRAALPFASATLTAVVVVLLIAVLDPAAALAVVAGMALALVALPAAGAWAGGRGALTDAARRSDRNALLVELADGADELAALGAGTTYLDRLDQLEAGAAGHRRHRAWAAAVVDALGTALVGGVTAAVVATSVDPFERGALAGTTVAVAALLALSGMQAVASVAPAFADVPLLTARLGRALRLLASSERDTGGKPSLTTSDPPGPATSGQHVRPIGARQVPDVVVDAVRVGGGTGRRPVLDGVDLVIGSGERIAVVGPSGSGKTTLGYALLGFVDLTNGSVRFVPHPVDGSPADGPPADGPPGAPPTGVMAWAPSEVHIFRTTLRENLRLAAPAASDGDLVGALDTAGLGSWFEGLADGLGTDLAPPVATRPGDGRRWLSGGERRRLGVARALVSGRPVVILDEPTAHLDRATASALRSSVVASAGPRSVVWITHPDDAYGRSDLEGFDRVVTLAAGKVSSERS